MVSHHYTEKELIKKQKAILSKAKAGDEDALEWIHDHLENAVFSYRWENRPAAFNEYVEKKDEILASTEKMLDCFEFKITWQENTWKQ